MSGRPKAIIDWAKVNRLLLYQCNGVSIAGIIGIHPETLYDACKQEYNIGFSDYSHTKKAEGKELLRAKQFETAMSGDKTMLIWLGKQYLEQKDNNDYNIKVNEDKLNELARTFEQKVVSATEGSYVPQSNTEILE